MAMPAPFEINGLYILLSDRGENSFAFHWSFYLHHSASPASGYIFHLINTTNSTTWTFDTRPSENVMLSERLLLALKVGVLDPSLHQSFLDCLGQIPIEYSTRFREKITCRVWLKEALFALDDEGYIMLTRNVNDIEVEARNAAMLSKSQGRRRMVARSLGSQA